MLSLRSPGRWWPDSASWQRCTIITAYCSTSLESTTDDFLLIKSAKLLTLLEHLVSCSAFLGSVLAVRPEQCLQDVCTLIAYCFVSQASVYLAAPFP